MNEDRFWVLDWNEECHALDLESMMQRGNLVTVVDENAGGVIAYAIGHDHAKMIAAALNASPAITMDTK